MSDNSTVVPALGPRHRSEDETHEVGNSYPIVLREGAHNLIDTVRFMLQKPVVQIILVVTIPAASLENAFNNSTGSKVATALTEQFVNRQLRPTKV